LIKAAIVTLNEDLCEFEELADSAGYEVVFEVIQKRGRPDPTTYLGGGKLAELRGLLEDYPVDAILVNDDLRPTQHYKLENALRVECIDRIRLVLNLFAKKAKDKLARLQVEKSRLEYEIPFLREWIHNAKRGEHPGFLGSGEYQVDVYYDLIKKRMGKIDDELRKINSQYELRRDQRRKKGFYLISLAGYTNAGKSSLLRNLTGAPVMIDHKMFSTLSTTTRKMDGVGKDILVTDTIGFLHDLPHFMIESFRTAIEEIFLADLIILVVDASDEDEELMRKLRTSSKIIFPAIDPEDVIVALNKVDLVEREIQRKIELVEDIFPCAEVIPTSIKEEIGIDMLIDTSVSAFQYPYRIDFISPNTPDLSRLISWLYDEAEVNEVSYQNQVKVSLKCRSLHYDRILERIDKLPGKVLYAGREASFSSRAVG